MRPVLFASRRPLDRAENIKAVFEAWDGEKRFVQMDPWRRHQEFDNDAYNVLVTDEVPASTPGKTIFIGHGMSGGKLYGLDQPLPYMTPEQANALTYAICTSDRMIGITAQMFRIPRDRVLPLGMPRTDQYIGASKGDGGTFLAKKRAYLYCPTYRGELEQPYPEIDWRKIDGLLLDDEILAVKDHMMGQKHRGELEGCKHIWEISKDIPTAPYLIDCDVLVTDYSSIMLDAHMLRKPVVLFSKDREHYLQKRGMYLDYPHDYAGRFTDTEERLVNIMRTAKKENDFDKECRKVTGNACDGHSTERVVELIKELNADA